MLCVCQAKTLDLCTHWIANEIFFVICTRFESRGDCTHIGEMLEWLKRHAWKACIRLKCIAGSNPAFSANLFLLIF